jgi:hypothetical protein
MVCIFDPACELLPPMEEGTILYLCTVAPLPYLLSDLLHPQEYIQTVTRFRTYKIASPPLTKMTSKDETPLRDWCL